MSDVIKPNGVLSDCINNSNQKESESHDDLGFEDGLKRLPSFLVFFVLLGIFWLSDQLINLTKEEILNTLNELHEMGVKQRLNFALRSAFRIKLEEKQGNEEKQVVVACEAPKCSHCQSEMKILPGSTYKRKTKEFLEDLRIVNMVCWLPQHLHLQRWCCKKKNCQKTGSGLSQKELPYSKSSIFTMNWVFTSYLTSCASFRSIKLVGEAHIRSFSVGFLWKKIQQLGKQFMVHREQFKDFFTGNWGLDECYPRTVKGKIGVIAAIDQISHLIGEFYLGYPFTNKNVSDILIKVKRASIKVISIVTDLSTIYPLGIHKMGGKILHIGCIVHIKRHLKDKTKAGLKIIDRIEDNGIKMKFTMQMEAINLLIGDIFTSRDSIEALNKLEDILELEIKYADNKALKPFFKYLRNHKDILINTHYGWGIPIHNNYIERFFGFIRHKLRIVRGWKKNDTFLNFFGALAIYRNFINLQNKFNPIITTITGEQVQLGVLNFAEYLMLSLPNAGISSPSTIPISNSNSFKNASVYLNQVSTINSVDNQKTDVNSFLSPFDLLGLLKIISSKVKTYFY